MANLNLYKCFCVVAKEKNISKASEVLFISQPALSFSIKELEKELNQTLFIRKSKGVELTTFGKVLYNKIKDVIDVFDEAENLANRFNNLQEGIIRIGSSSSNANQMLTKYLTKFAKAYPSINISMRRGTREKLSQDLKNNELDLIFVDKFNDFSDFEMIKEYDIKYQLIGSKTFKNKYTGDNISAKDFPVEDLILPSKNNNSRVTIDDFFAKSGINLAPKYELDNYILLYEFVKNGLGIAFVNAEYYQKNIEEKEVEVIYPNFSINARHLVCLTNKDVNNLALKKFVEIINDCK